MEKKKQFWMKKSMLAKVQIGGHNLSNVAGLGEEFRKFMGVRHGREWYLGWQPTEFVFLGAAGSR